MKQPLIIFRWQYFGSTTGIVRIYPGREWSTNFAGFYNDYDPRVRPWYIAATSGPKDVIIILDCRFVNKECQEVATECFIKLQIYRLVQKYSFCRQIRDCSKDGLVLENAEIVRQYSIVCVRATNTKFIHQCFSLTNCICFSFGL